MMTSEIQFSSADTPLFVTRFGLSAKSAIGVQTQRFMAPFPEARHLYWDRRDLGRTDPRSHSIERLLPSRLSPLKRPGPLLNLFQTIRLTGWRGADFAPGVRVKLTAMRNSVSAIYLAPIGADDAFRMRRIVEYIQRPYVVHLWDSLDVEPTDDPDLGWLLKNANKVYGLTETLLAASGRADAELLLFSRSPASIVAEPPRPGKPLRVATVGDLLSYQAGLALLIAACQRLTAAGRQIELVYIGPTATWRRLPEKLRRNLVRTGFLPSDQHRDKVLASCHLGFMPGPLASPDTDLRSRYSIPSRILDFMALGLPVVGTVHPRSATHIMAERFGIADKLSDTAEHLAMTIDMLAEPTAWHAASKASLSGFTALNTLNSVEQLARDLQRIGHSNEEAGRKQL